MLRSTSARPWAATTAACPDLLSCPRRHAERTVEFVNRSQGDVAEPALEERVAKLEGRVDGFEGRFDSLERRFDSLARDIVTHQASFCLRVATV